MAWVLIAGGSMFIGAAALAWLADARPDDRVERAEAQRSRALDALDRCHRRGVRSLPGNTGTAGAPKEGPDGV